MGDHNETKRRVRRAVRAAIGELEELLSDRDADIRRIDVSGENEIALDLGSTKPYKRMALTGLQTMRIEIEIYRAPRKRASPPKEEFHIGTAMSGQRWCLPVGIDRSTLTDISPVRNRWCVYVDCAGERHDCATYARQAGIVEGRNT